MFLMADKISFIIKSLLTNVTLIWPDFVMDHSNMSAQVTLHPKGFRTLFTLIKSLLCVMRLEMGLQNTVTSKAFITLVTLELSFTNLMNSDHMTIQILFFVISFGT